MSRFEYREWKVEAYPKHARVFADFTGSTMQPKNPSELARIIEEGFEQQPFQHTVDVSVVPSTEALERARAAIARVVGIAVPKTPANDLLPDAMGLSGFAQTGKTTVANYIESKYGYRRQHIAEPLRAMLRTLLQRFGLEDELIERYLTGDLKEEFIPALKCTSRHAQITIGTEWGRNLIDDDLWARLWSYEAEAAGGKAMNDSVRFPNEEDAIQDVLGGFTILVKRPGTGPAAYKWGRFGRFLYTNFGLMWGVHDSERTDRLDPDYVIVNDGTLEQLYAEIDEIMMIEGATQCAA